MRRRNLSTGWFQYHNSSSRLLIPRGKEREREGKKRENDENVSKKCGASKFRWKCHLFFSSHLFVLLFAFKTQWGGGDDKTTERERERIFFFSKQNLRGGERRSSSNRRVKGKRKEQRDNFFFLLCLESFLDNDFCLFGTPPRLLISPHKRRTRKKEVSTDSTQRAVFYSVYFSVSL